MNISSDFFVWFCLLHVVFESGARRHWDRRATGVMRPKVKRVNGLMEIDTQRSEVDGF